MNDLIARARREYDYEQAAAWKHVLCCGYCIPTPCPMGQSVRENAAAYMRHLAMLAADMALAEGIAWMTPAQTRREHGATK